MRRIFSVLLALTALAAASVLTPSSGQAEPYPWCAQYNGAGGGGRNCGFTSREQCMTSASGLGGFCEQNPFYTGPAERPAKSARKRRND